MADHQTSQGKTRDLPPTYTPHLLSLLPDSYGALRIIALSPGCDSLVCDFCSSDQSFALRFLRIPPRGGHPCGRLTVSPAGPVEDLHLQVNGTCQAHEDTSPSAQTWPRDSRVSRGQRTIRESTVGSRRRVRAVPWWREGECGRRSGFRHIPKTGTVASTVTSLMDMLSTRPTRATRKAASTSRRRSWG